MSNELFRTLKPIGSISAGFWSKTHIPESPTACWEWQGAVSKNGYGCFAIGRTRRSAHRVALFLLQRKLIPSDVLVRHKCDNKRCVNPFHLETGTHKDNSQDMVRRGRSGACGSDQRGENNNNAKLSASDVESVKGMIEAGKNNTQIAEAFAVSHSAISCIRLSKCWGAQ